MTPLQTQFPITFITRNSSQFTYYVDSVNGDDGNSGRTSSQPLRTLGAVPALTAGQIVGLKRGSTFRAQKLATITTDDVSVVAYGDGDAPVLDGSTSLSVGGWTKTGGQTHVYERAITFDNDASGYVTMFEDDGYMVRQSSITNVDANAGSYHVTSDTSGSATLYIHPTGSGDPASNGRVYDYASTNMSVKSFDAQRTTLRDLYFRRSVNKDGPVYLGKHSNVYNCEFHQGARHNFIARGAVYIEDCTFADGYFGNAGATLFVCYENTPALTDAFTMVRCIASNTNSPDTNVQAFLNHGAGVSGEFGSGTYIDCQAVDCAAGWSGGSTEYVYTRCIADGCSKAVTIASPTQVSSFTEFQIINGTTGIEVNTGAQTLTLDGCDLNTTSGALINLNPNGCIIDVQNTTFNGGKNASAIITSATGLNITSRNNTFIIGWPYRFIAAAPSNNVMDSDFNQFENDSLILNRWSWDNTQYFNLLAWQSGTGFDTNSMSI